MCFKHFKHFKHFIIALDTKYIYMSIVNDGLAFMVSKAFQAGIYGSEYLNVRSKVIMNLTLKPNLRDIEYVY